MNSILIILLMAVVFIAPACDTPGNGQKEKPSDEPRMPVWGDNSETSERIWVGMDPIQCMNNPWEQNWMEANSGSRDTYPKGEPRVVEPNEAAIIKNYFQNQGTIISEVDYTSFPEDQMVCEACTCPEGYTLFLRIPRSDIDKMKEYGFEEVFDR